MTVSRLYRLGQETRIKFRIENLENETFNVTSRIYDSQGNQLSDEIHPEITDKMVNLLVPENLIEEVGDYIALFQISGDKLSKDLPIYFAVASPDAMTRTIGLPVERLTKESSDNELESALSETVRELRRSMDSFEAEKLAMNAARINTEKDLIPRELLQQAVKNAFSELKVTISL